MLTSNDAFCCQCRRQVYTMLHCLFLKVLGLVYSDAATFEEHVVKKLPEVFGQGDERLNRMFVLCACRGERLTITSQDSGALLRVVKAVDAATPLRFV